MKIIFGIIIGIIAISLVAVISGSLNKGEQPVAESSPQATLTPETFTPFTATFEIHTNGTKRIFTDPRYHNLSDEIFLDASDPSAINVQVSGITWSEFFKSLPMQLSKDCLVTGTGQTFCSDESSKLKFMINNVEDPNALDKEIKSGDHLEVVYNKI